MSENNNTKVPGTTEIQTPSVLDANGQVARGSCGSLNASEVPPAQSGFASLEPAAWYQWGNYTTQTHFYYNYGNMPLSTYSPYYMYNHLKYNTAREDAHIINDKMRVAELVDTLKYRTEVQKRIAQAVLPRMKSQSASSSEALTSVFLNSVRPKEKKDDSKPPGQKLHKREGNPPEKRRGTSNNHKFSSRSSRRHKSPNSHYCANRDYRK